MPDNVIGDVFEGLSQTVGQTVKQAVKAPLDILETGVGQVSGKGHGGQMPDDDGVWQAKHHQKMISQMKQSDDQNKQSQMAAIRQNIAAMMQPSQSPGGQELPKYVSGKPGFSMDKINKQEEEKKKNKLPDLLDMLKMKNRGSGERHRGVSG